MLDSSAANCMRCHTVGRSATGAARNVDSEEGSWERIWLYSFLLMRSTRVWVSTACMISRNIDGGSVDSCSIAA